MYVDIEDLTHIYGRNIKALNSISLRIQSGVFGLLGPNGAGKTTLMKVLATLLVPTSGKVVVDGIDVIQQPQKLREFLGYLPQEFGFYGNLTGEEMLDFVACMKNVKNTRRKVGRS